MSEEELFLSWLSGAIDLVGDEPPTAEQWERIRDKASAALARVVAQRFRNTTRAEHYNRVFAQAVGAPTAYGCADTGIDMEYRSDER